MSEARTLTRRHLNALLEEGRGAGLDPDVIGRTLLQELVAIMLERRSPDDVSSELRFVADNLDPDTDFEFMRP